MAEARKQKSEATEKTEKKRLRAILRRRNAALHRRVGTSEIRLANVLLAGIGPVHTISEDVASSSAESGK